MPIFMLWPGIEGTVIRLQKKWIKLSTFGMVVKRYFKDEPKSVRSIGDYFGEGFLSPTAVVTRMSLARSCGEGESCQDDRRGGRFSGGPRRSKRSLLV